MITLFEFSVNSLALRDSKILKGFLMKKYFVYVKTDDKATHFINICHVPWESWFNDHMKTGRPKSAKVQYLIQKTVGYIQLCISYIMDENGSSKLILFSFLCTCKKWSWWGLWHVTPKCGTLPYYL